MTWAESTGGAGVAGSANEWTEIFARDLVSVYVFGLCGSLDSNTGAGGELHHRHNICSLDIDLEVNYLRLT